MGEITEFTSRKGTISCNAGGVYRFVTNLDNFRQFIPEGTISGWHSDADSCRFEVNSIGSVNIRLTLKQPNSRVVYSGEALQNNSFSIDLDITGTGESSSVASLVLRTETNPLMKMIIAKPASQFLEMMISEMEGFRGWDLQGEQT